MNLDMLKQAILGTEIEALIPMLQNSQLSQIKQGDSPRWQFLLSQMPKIETSSKHFGDVVKIGDSKDIDDVTYNDLKTYSASK